MSDSLTMRIPVFKMTELCPEPVTLPEGEMKYDGDLLDCENCRGCGLCVRGRKR